jgi:Phage integrase family
MRVGGPPSGVIHSLYPWSSGRAARSGVDGKAIMNPAPAPSVCFFKRNTLGHLVHRGRPDADALVFVAPEGGPLRRSKFRTRVFDPAVRRAGLDGLTFHGLRHTAAGLMIEAGAHIEAIKQRLGHSSIQ